MNDESTFGAKPEQLKRLLTAIGLGDSSADEQDGRTASQVAPVNNFMEQPGTQIGRYKLLRVLGEGGMGTVYLAEQQGSIRRRVALKVIKPGMDSKRVLARFEAERQALALLDHPNIAHVYDSGTTEVGRPYFVMEHVKGLPITEHCDHYKLTIEQRFKLFQQVCQAVHHAHQKGIIHRDIKPSNIIVSIHEDQALPKMIDFGVAKAVSQPLTERTLYTEQGQLFGTPEYMSPEQADMAVEDIDTRSDIYSLGVLLYELLTGVLPFDPDTLRTGGIDHIRQIIRETDPKIPSTRVSNLGEEAKKIAELRRMEIRALAKHLKKELEWIPLKAMRKERSERYRSASELADDIENYLKGAPLIAGPPNATYRARKFVRRHKALVTGITAVLAVLVAGIAISTIFAIGQARARAEAQLIADFLENDVLGSADKARVGEATVSYILDAASKNLEDKFKGKPLIEASLHRKLGWTYRRLGEASKAEQHWLSSIRLYRQNLGEEHPTTLRAVDDIGWVYEDQGRYRDMEQLWARNLQIKQRVSSIEDQLFTMNALAITLYYLGRYNEAESLYDKILQTAQREVGQENLPRLPYWKCNCARVYTAEGRYEVAEQLFTEGLKSVVPSDDFSRWAFFHTRELADMYIEQGLYDKAEPLLTKTLETQREVLGANHLHTLLSICDLARLYTAQDRYEEAEALFCEALPIARQRLRPEHPVTLRLVNAYAMLRTRQKQYDEAETFFNEALKGRQHELGDDHPHTLETKNDLGVMYKEQGCYNEAESLLLDAVEGRRLKLGDTHPHTKQSTCNLIDLYEAWNKPEQAEEWRAKLPQTEAIRR